MDFENHKKPNEKPKFRYYAFFYQNVRGLRTKLDPAKQTILTLSADVYALTETFLVSGVYDGELFPGGYTVARRDRADDRGWGGVLLAARDSLNMQQILDIEGYSHEIEIVVAILTLKYKKIVCCVVYIPPHSSEDRYSNTFSVLENVIAKFPKLDIIILGDFNLNSCSQDIRMHYESMVSSCKLKQHNTITNKCEGILDLVLSDRGVEWIKVSGDTEPLVPDKVDGYHPPLWVSVRSARQPRPRDGASRARLPSPDRDHNVPREWNFRKADFHSLYTAIAAIDWNVVYLQTDVDEAVTTFMTY